MIDLEGHFDALFAATTGAAIFTLAIVWGRRRTKRVSISHSTYWALAAALMLTLVAIAQPHWRRKSTVDVVVMVDCSASTRGATYRDTNTLLARLNQLFPASQQPNVHWSQVRFAEFNEAQEQFSRLHDAGIPAHLSEIASDRTRFVLPDIECDAIVLFSDGQFHLQAMSDREVSPPVFPVIDPQLENVIDGKITRLSVEGDLRAAASNHSASERELRVSAGDTLLKTTRLHEGSVVEQVNRSSLAKTNNEIIAARLTPGDAWQENDVLTMRVSGMNLAGDESWWIGSRAPSGDWIRFADPSSLPSEVGSFLQAAVIVLENQTIESLPVELQQHLLTYVRDFGGTLIVSGGPNAFAAGGYVGSILDRELLPLASAPPTPERHWTFLLDASGSMDQSIVDRKSGASQSKWKMAIEAMREQFGKLPPNDWISIASFSRDLRWWVQSRHVGDFAAAAPTFAPPRDVFPNGPTNLQAALSTMAGDSNPDGTPASILLITDGDAALPDISSIRTAMAAARSSLNVLSTLPIPADSPLAKLAADTGGTCVAIADETAQSSWTVAMSKLARAAGSTALLTAPTTIQFDASALLQSRVVDLTNIVWPKRGATMLAKISDGRPLAAQHRVGLGNVTALAFVPSTAEIAAMIRLAPSGASDPRFQISWINEGQNTHLTIAATDGDHFLNGLCPQLKLLGTTSTTTEIPQTAPGRYELDCRARQDTQSAIVTVNNHVISRHEIPSRYAREFENLGNNRPILQALADHTHGRLIETGDNTPLVIRGRYRSIPLAPPFAVAAAALFATVIVLAVRGR